MIMTKIEPYFTSRAQVGDIIDVYNSRGVELDVYVPSKVMTKVYDKEKYKGLEFMVVKAGLKISHQDDLNDYNGWNVVARQLNSRGNYNPKGKSIRFFQDEYAELYFRISKVKVIGKMKIKYER